MEAQPLSVHAWTPTSTPRSRPTPEPPPGASHPAAHAEGGPGGGRQLGAHTPVRAAGTPGRRCAEAGAGPQPGTGQPRDRTGRTDHLTPALPYLSLLSPLPSAAGESGKEEAAATLCSALAALTMAARVARGGLAPPPTPGGRHRPTGAAAAPRPPRLRACSPLTGTRRPPPGSGGEQSAKIRVCGNKWT